MRLLGSGGLADERGGVMLMVALFAPVAILLYCGFAELTMAMMAERRRFSFLSLNSGCTLE